MKNINSESELNEFKDLVAYFFAQKAQKAIDALWDNGTINEDTIKQWGSEHMHLNKSKKTEFVAGVNKC